MQTWNFGLHLAPLILLPTWLTHVQATNKLNLVKAISPRVVASMWTLTLVVAHVSWLLLFCCCCTAVALLTCFERCCDAVGERCGRGGGHRNKSLYHIPLPVPGARAGGRSPHPHLSPHEGPQGPRGGVWGSGRPPGPVVGSVNVVEALFISSGVVECCSASLVLFCCSR